MSRVEMVECDLEGCGERHPSGSDGLTLVHFAGRIFDFCSSEHQAKWERELVELDPAKRKRAKR